MKRSHRTSLLLAFALACSGPGPGCLKPLPTGFSGQRLPSSANARITQPGFDFINSHWPALLAGLGQANPIAVPIPCTPIGIGSSGHFCDQNRNNGCDPGERCNVSAQLTNFAIDPAGSAPNTGLLKVKASLQISTGDMWLRTCAARIFGTCICRVTCGAKFDSDRSGNPVDEFSADVTFSLDPTYGNILAFDVVNVNGINSIESGDLVLTSQGICSGIACTVISIGFIKSFVIDQFVKPELQRQVRRAIDGARCRSCGPGQPLCPGASTCQSGKCRSGATCVPTLFGVEGLLDLNPAVSPQGELEMMAVAGGSLESQAMGHFTTGVIGGANPLANDPCVPLVVPELPSPIPAPDWSGPDGGYHFGLTLSGQFLNHLGWATHQSGGLCLNLSAAEVPFLNSGVFKVLLPSLGTLATRDGEDAPMRLVVRPGTAPLFEIGAGTVDPMTGQPADPLVKLTMKNLALDFYVRLDDRDVRFLTIETDVALPLSLAPEGCDRMVPVVGDLSQAIVIKSVSNNELLAEDSAQLQQLLPVALQVAGPALATALGGLALPEIGGFKVAVRSAQGVTPVSNGQFAHLGLFANLMPPGVTCRSAAYSPRVFMATGSLRQLQPSKALGPDRVMLRLSREQLPAEPEVSFRVNGGLWSMFQPVNSDEVLVHNPMLALQLRHSIEVRVRPAAEPWDVSEVTQLEVLVDTEAPTARWERDERGVPQLVAFDRQTPAQDLEFSVSFSGGPQSEFRRQRPLFTERELEDGVTVWIRDGAGNIGRVDRARTLGVARHEAPAELPQSAGCSTAGAHLGLACCWLVGRRRRRKSAENPTDGEALGIPTSGPSGECTRSLQELRSTQR